jgi:chemotaxis signal transduction protein
MGEKAIGKMMRLQVTEDDFVMVLAIEVSGVIELPSKEKLIPIPGSKPWLMGCMRYFGVVIPIIDWGIYKGQQISSAAEVIIIDDGGGAYVGLAVKIVEGLTSIGNISDMLAMEGEETLGEATFENKKWKIVNVGSTLNKIAQSVESSENEKV